MIIPDGGKLCNFACCRLLENTDKLRYLEAPKQTHWRMKNFSQQESLNLNNENRMIYAVVCNP